MHIDAHRCTSVQSQRMCTGEENLGHWPTMYNICIRGLSLFQTSRMEKSYSYGVSKTFLIWIPRRQHGISIRSRHHRPENSDWISRFLCQFNLWSTSKIPKLGAPKFRDNSDLKTDTEDLRRSEKIMNPPIIHLGHQRTAPNEVDRVAGPTFPWRLRPHHPVVEIIPSEHWMVYFMGNHNLKWMI